MELLDDLLTNAINDSIQRTLRNNNRLLNRYYTSTRYVVDEEENYILEDHDDLSSTVLLEIVTSFGSPGNDNFLKELRKRQMKNLPKYKKVKNECECECPICIEPLSKGEYYRELACKHTFHKKCIDRWFKKDHSDCPMCRQKIL